MDLLDRIYNDTGATLNQVTLNNIGKYNNLLVMISYSKRNPASFDELKGICYLDVGTEIGAGGYRKNGTASGHIIRVYKVSVSGNSITIELHGTNHYQIFGMEVDEDITLIEAFVNNGTAVTSVSVDWPDDIIFFCGNSQFTGKTYEEEQSTTYVTPTETTYSAYYKNSNTSSSVVKTSMPKGPTEFTGRWFGYVVIGVIHNPKAGDINAIRDWFNWSRYCKDDVDNFFINGYNEGLVAYDTSIRGLPDDVVILEGDTSEKVYKVKLNSDGKAKRLLFFDNSEDLYVTMKNGTRTVSLNTQRPTIYPVCNNLIPAMTSNTTPSGEASASTEFTEANFKAYMSMNQIDCDISTLQGCWLAKSADTKPWIKYDFGENIFPSVLQLDLVNNGPTVQKELFIEGSLNNTDWFNLLDAASITKTFTRSAHESSYTPLNWSKCRYIRIRCNEPLYGGANQYACGFNTIQVIGIEDT